MGKKIGIAAAIVIALFLVVVATRPATFSISRSATIAAPAPVVYSLINDFHQWNGWSPWEKLDPTMAKTFSGPPAGTGSIYEWKGQDKVGEGRMTIVGTRPNEQVDIKLEFIKPFEATNKTLFDIKPGSSATTVTWTMSGDNNFFAKAMSLFMDMEKMVGPDFERGLAAMKTLAETEAARQAEEAKKAAAAAAAAQAAAQAAAAAAAQAAAAAPPTAAPAKK